MERTFCAADGSYTRCCYPRIEIAWVCWGDTSVGDRRTDGRAESGTATRDSPRTTDCSAELGQSAAVQQPPSDSLDKFPLTRSDFRRQLVGEKNYTDVGTPITGVCKWGLAFNHIEHKHGDRPSENIEALVNFMHRERAVAPRVVG